jgi:hypothetical protein
MDQTQLPSIASQATDIDFLSKRMPPTPKVATVEIVKKCSNFGNFSVLQILDWIVVVPKTDLKVGDKCVYIRIDTLVNTKSKYFMTFKTERSDGWLYVKPHEIFGIMSSGLVIKDDIFNEYNIGDDVSAIIGAKKSLKDICTASADPFPTEIIWPTFAGHLQDSGIERLIGKHIYVSVKLDGQSWTAFVEGDLFTRTCRATTGTIISNKFIKIILPKINTALESGIILPNDFIFQGEFCGDKVNGNRMKLKGNRFYIFTIYSRIMSRYLSLDEMTDVCRKLGIDMVTCIDAYIHTEDKTVEYYENLANSTKYPGDIPAEGIVIRESYNYVSDCIGDPRRYISCFKVLAK